MYLQSLEMVGFKSFAPKTVLQFNEGVTAVVGPNGCGKSNVLDALRWVLGEQSAKALRGGEMADVIFSGTDNRSPLGMAEVSLTFSDCEKELGVEWNEVRITRRVFRDGKSEYLLNKAPCRLKDIQQLFMDTGIGRSAYSIMEQGKIADILSSRPEDRRSIFEEAAGITRYKTQKKEALRKLEYTEANLLRVTDIIKEVKRQIGSLQRQAGKARRYQALMEDLRTFDMHLSHRNFMSLRAELNDVKASLAGLEDTRAVQEQEIESKEAELDTYRARLGDIEQSLTSLRDEIQSQRNRIYAAEMRIASNVERSEETQGMIERNRMEITIGEEKRREQESEVARTDAMIAELLELLHSGEAQLSEADSKVRALREERISEENSAQSLQSEITHVETRLSEIRRNVSASASRREAGETRLQILRSEAASAGELLAAAKSRIVEAQTRIENTAAELVEAQSRQEKAQTAYDEAQSKRQQFDHDFNIANRALAEQESRIEVLRQLTEAGEGLGEGTQAVLRGLDNANFFKPAVQGALTSLIEVDAQYVPAIEAALGGNLQAIVFKDSDVAESAITTLGSQKLGRAAISPRDWFVDQQMPSSQPLPEGALTWAIDCVRIIDEAGILAKQLLSDIAVVEKIETAFALKSQYRTLGFVTLSGEFISREGIVHGGAESSNPTSVLARKNQILALEREISASQALIVQCQARRAEAMETIKIAQDALRMAREAVQAAHVAHSTAKSEGGMIERQGAEAEMRRENLSREIATLEETVRHATDCTAELEGEMNGLEEALFAVRSRQGETQTRIDAARTRENLAIEELNELRVRVATERQQQEALTRQRDPLTARITELTELLAQREQDIADYKARISHLQSESVEMQSSIENWQLLLKTGEEQVVNILSQRGELQENMDSIEAALRTLRRQLGEVQENRSRLEVRSTQLEMRTENVIAHVAQRYQCSIEDFQPDTYSLLTSLRDRKPKVDREPNAEIGLDEEEQGCADCENTEMIEEPETIPWNRIEELVTELTGKVDSMGPVNLDAIQEYDELEQRHTFLEQQNTDLINSKAELLEVIAKINVTTKELFSDTFEKIRVNFQEMFTELFGGGKANLLLTDESNPLECGIEIIAKPPGKQLQSISLLSGGEKTMTAVALLFSIYMVKPSPFCVLDEMDAPLDESNINRFIKILDRFVDQSQFVVITHNKGTIARADTVFGVTMEEHGVSKIVGVKFQGNQDSTAQTFNGRTTSIAEAFGKHGNLHSEQEAVALPS